MSAVATFWDSGDVVLNGYTTATTVAYQLSIEDLLLSRPAPAEVRPNRRGVRSRERVLDAAERIMATRGFEAATLARVVEESCIPMSSVYHYYFGSKDRILLAVMERGADRFFADLPDLSRRPGRPAQHLARVASAATRTLCQADRGVTLEGLLRPLVPSLVATRRALLAKGGPC